MLRSDHTYRLWRWGLVAILLLVAGGCGSSRPYTLGPVKTFDPDNRPIPAPESPSENQYWDRLDLSLIYQLEKPLDLTWTGREVGHVLGVAGEKQADNVNALDEVPNSSWYTRRHYHHRMTPRELARGPNERDTTGTPAGPDTSDTWTVVSGKMEGAGAGFVIEDSRGDRYLIKLDGTRWPGLASTAEVVSTKIFYAAGYHVPQNTITHFHPDQLRIGEGAEVRQEGDRRPMRPGDLTAILKDRKRRADGRIRALASKYVDGRPHGPWNFRGTRSDDPNDRVRHEHRRELRALRVIGSWLNDADRRAANTLAVYTDDRYVKHYLIDMGSTLGANGGSSHRPIHGQAYMIDPRYMARLWLSLGLYERPWMRLDSIPMYPSVGYFRADAFRPGEWVPTYPNPAFEKLTLRDAFWGAKIVMSFSDEDLQAIVGAAQMENPDAEAYLLDVLKRRRDKVGRYWFARINPLDRFRVAPRNGDTEIAARSGAGQRPGYVLRFEDLAVTGGLERPETSSYVYTIRHDGRRLQHTTTEAPIIPLTTSGNERIEAYLARRGITDDEARVMQVEIRTRREHERSKYVRAYVHYPANGAAPRVAGLEREE